MTNICEELSRGWSLCFRRGRSGWKSLKNNNTAGGGLSALLRKGLAALLGVAVPDFVVRARSAKPKRSPHG